MKMNCILVEIQRLGEEAEKFTVSGKWREDSSKVAKREIDRLSLPCEDGWILG
jgi:hypothetical protein